MEWVIDGTHDARRESWVESANEEGSEFPIQNLPYCVVDAGEGWEVGVAIGSCVFRLERAVRGGAVEGICTEEERAGLAGLLGWGKGWVCGCGGVAWWERAERGVLRGALSRWLTRGEEGCRAALERWVVESGSVRFGVPVPVIRNYTDFYASVYHATNVGSMFRPEKPLLPNYKHVPIAYHGRASSIVASGTDVRRPVGQLPPGGEGEGPGFGPSRLLDYEAEVGVVVSRGNALGEPVRIGEAEGHVLGLCLVNDWSARDIQRWEYQPLGPFLSKSFATTVGTVVVTMEALAPFRCGIGGRGEGDPEPMGYLRRGDEGERGGIDVVVEVYLRSEEMRRRGLGEALVSRGSFREMYWTVAQMVAHHTVNGCNLEAGDLLASGTVSGRSRSSRGCLLELTWEGDPWGEEPRVAPGTARRPVRLPSGEERRFLEDGDEVVMRGYCERAGYRRIGLGECRGRVVAGRQPA